MAAGISEEEDESGGFDEDEVTSLMNGYRHGVVNDKAAIDGSAALTLSQAIARCDSLTDILFGDTELLTAACNNTCQSDDYEDTNEVLCNRLSLRSNGHSPGEPGLAGVY